MAHQNHRGWLTKPNEGILAAVYNGVMPGTTLLAANTALEGVLVGTPVSPALAVDSLVISNLVPDGDIAIITTSTAGNSQAGFVIDASAGTTTIYAAGVAQLGFGSGSVVFNDASADVNFRIETDGLAYAIYSDGGKNALVLGGNTDTSSADQLITVSRAARTATTTVNYFDLAIAPAGAVTIPAGTTAVVASASVAEPNITATGTVTNATTLYIASQPTEGGTTNSAIFFGAAANIAGTTNIVFNDQAQDVDHRIETAAMAYAVYADAGKNALVLGSNTDTSSADQLVTISRAARTSTTTVNYFDLAVAPAGAVTVPAGTTAVVASVSIAEPNITATGTVTNAATLYIASQPTEGGTTNSAIRFGAAANISGTTSITINEDSEDLDFRIESNGNANMFVLDAGLDAIGIGGAAAANQTLTVTNAALNATLGRVAKFSGTVAAPFLGDGYGAVEVDITSSGTVAGESAAFSSWLNLADGSVPGGNRLCAQNIGIYVPTGITASSAKMIAGSRISYIAQDGANPGSLFLFSTNIYSNVLTAMFDVNAIADLGGSTGAQASNDYKIPLFKDATANQVWYVNVYHS